MLSAEDIEDIAIEYSKVYWKGDKITALDLILYLHHRNSAPGCGFFSIERPCQKATNSEIRRWFNNKAISINGTRPAFNDNVDFPIWELTLFPKAGGKRIILASKGLPFILIQIPGGI